MNHQDLINTCIFEQIQVLLFSDLSGPLRVKNSYKIRREVHSNATTAARKCPGKRCRGIK